MIDTYQVHPRIGGIDREAALSIRRRMRDLTHALVQRDQRHRVSGSRSFRRTVGDGTRNGGRGRCSGKQGAERAHNRKSSAGIRSHFLLSMGAA